jgi:hypothetical protein
MPTTRRLLLALVGTAGVSALAGCTADGANPFLKLESGLDEPVTLSIEVRLAATNEVTSEGEYEVPARSLRRVEVLGANRYRVTASAAFDSVTFECEPTCASATTAVFVTPERELNAAVQRCPGG